MMMKRFLPLLLAAMLLACGCAPSTAPNAPGAPEAPVPTGQPAPEAPAGAPTQEGGVTLLTAGLTRGEAAAADKPDYAPAAGFSFSLLARALSDAEKNPVLSPLSAYLCLAMVQNGANADTLRAFASVLGTDTDALNRLCRALSDGLLDTAGSTKLSIANSAWLSSGKAKLEQQYLQDITDWFGADVYSADLSSAEALAAINAWVNEKTNGLIPTLHDEPYSPSTVLVLLNTLYFKAAWKDEFMGWLTYDEAFTAADGARAEVPFMHASYAQRDCIRTADAEGVLLPYDDGKTAFIALMPTAGDARRFAASLTPASFAAYLAAAEDTLVNLSLPKFTVEFSLPLNACLSDLGLQAAFNPGEANFTRMGTSTDGALYLSQVFQKVKIEVNEKGTEAAAVTESAMAGAGFIPEQPLELRFDRPFVYAVVDLASGLPLFIGVLDTPAA